jgi:hypothetical protein
LRYFGYHTVSRIVTGTAYVDVVAITNDNLSRDGTGALWLKYQQGKNGKLCRVKLLPKAIALIKKYRNKSGEPPPDEVRRSQGEPPQHTHDSQYAGAAHLSSRKTQRFVCSVESKLVTQEIFRTGNDLETSESQSFTPFCTDIQRTTFSP